MNKGTAIVGFILSFAAGMMLMWGIEKGGQGGLGSSATARAAAGAWSDEASPVPVSSQDPTWGNRDAPVTIVLFSDFECPFCTRVETTLEQVKQTYGPEKVRIVWKNQPLAFHKNAKPAAEAAHGVFEMAGLDAFWKFHDLAFKNQRQLNTDNYVKWAQEVGVTNIEEFKQGLEQHRWAAKVDKDIALAKQLGVNGTPHSIINGISLSGAQPFDKFKELIDAQLEKAQAAIAAGTKPDQVYVKLSKEQHKAAPEQPKRESPQEDKSVWKVPVGDSPSIGPDTALVTMVVFSDFQCPFCKRVEPTIQQVLDTYKDKVRLVWKHQPLSFHPRAEPAAQIAELAYKEKGAKGFFEARDALFESMPKLDDADLIAVAKKIGLSEAKAKRALETKQFKARIDADAELAENVQANGTPHFFINGRRFVGAQPFEKFKEIIDEELKKAEELVKKGTAPKDLYATIIKDGKEPPPPERKEIPAPTANNPWKGGANAKVVIQEFSEYQCPFCKRVEPTVKQILDTYGDKVKVVFRHKPLPFHGDAPLAAEATVEAFKQKGNDGFWKMHDLIFENQSTPNGLKREALEKYAEQVGLDMTKFKAALDTRAHKAAVEADSKIADAAGISGTPAFVINGYFVSGAQPFSRFKRVIDRALAEAK